MIGLPAVIALAIDQAAKLAITAHFHPGCVVNVLSCVDFTVLTDTGGAFGILSTAGGILWPSVALGMSLLVVCLLARWALAVPAYGSVSLALRRVASGLLIGGCVGDALDRIRVGGVIDFVDVHWGTFHVPLFNVADASICVGVLLWVLSSALKRSGSKTSQSKCDSKSTVRTDPSSNVSRST